jgi:hypothetical protein
MFSQRLYITFNGVEHNETLEIPQIVAGAAAEETFVLSFAAFFRVCAIT